MLRTLTQYILEARKRAAFLDRSRIIVFDIDDTLIRASSNNFFVYKQKDGVETKLTTAEYAHDPDKRKPGVTYDYRDFRDPDKVYQSIISGTPIMSNIKLMDKYLRNGWCFCFLTARSLEDVVSKALRKVLRTRTKDGHLKKLGTAFRRKESVAVNDDSRWYLGATDEDKKAAVLKDICARYKEVVFVDDDPRNVAAAEALNLPNLKVIRAKDV